MSRFSRKIRKNEIVRSLREAAKTISNPKNRFDRVGWAIAKANPMEWDSLIEQNWPIDWKVIMLYSNWMNPDLEIDRFPCHNARDEILNMTREEKILSLLFVAEAIENETI